MMEGWARRSLPNPSDGLRWCADKRPTCWARSAASADGKVPNALLTMVADKELPLIQRGKAAQAVGRLKGMQGNMPNSDTYIKAFASFGSDALADNLPGNAKRVWAVSRDFVERSWTLEGGFAHAEGGQ